MNEVKVDREALLSDVEAATRSQRRRLSEVRAREQVGAAGWAQTTALEDIIRAGRQGLVATDTLRQVIRLTTEQLRAVPLSGVSDEQQEHVEALHQIVDNGQQQLTAAEALEEILYQALQEVAQTPTEEINVMRLRSIHERVKQQLEALNTIISAAQAQTRTLEQVAELEKVSAEHQHKVDELQQFSAEEELVMLGNTAQDIVHRMTQLDEAAPEQVDALTRIARTVVDKMPETAALPHEQAEALTQLAHVAQEKASEILEEQPQPG